MPLSEDLDRLNSSIRQLQTKWHAWAENVNVLPFPEDRGKAKPNRPPEIPTK